MKIGQMFSHNRHCTMKVVVLLSSFIQNDTVVVEFCVSLSYRFDYVRILILAPPVLIFPG